MVAAFRRGLLKLYVMPLISNMTASMTWSIAVIYALDLGANIFQVNLITTIWSTMSIVILLPFGILSDRMGRRPMLLYPRVMMLLGTLIRAVASEPNHLLLGALVGGFAGGGFFPVLLSMIGDVAKPEEQKKAISTLYLFSGISMLVGPLICSFLLTMPQVTLRTIYQIDTFAQAITLVYIMTQIQETLPQTKEPKNGRAQIKYRDYISQLIRQSNFRGLLTMSVLFFFCNSIITTYIPIYARVNLNLSDAEIASFSTYRSLAITLIRFSAATFLAKVSIRPFLISALTLGGITALATAFANDYLSTVLIMFFSGASFGATMILGATITTMSSEQRNRGVANSLYNSAQSIGNITKILTSPIADNLGLIPVLFLGGITALIATVPALLCKGERVSK